MRRLHLVLLAVLIAISAAAVGIWQRNTQEVVVVQSPREYARHLIESCQWAAAVAACDALLVEVPDDGEVYFWRGRANFALGHNDAALEDYSAAIAKRPHDAEPLYCRGMVYERVGKADLADADYEAARKIDPRRDKLAEAIREEQTAADVRRVVREASRYADERADRLKAAKNSLTQQRTAALRESNQADQLAAEFAASEKANASSTANLGSSNTADVTANKTTWAGVDVASPFAEKPKLPESTFSPFAKSNQEQSGPAGLPAPIQLHGANAYGEGPAPAASAADSAGAAKDVASSETKEDLPESPKANDVFDSTAERSLAGQSLWQQLQQQSVQRNLAAMSEGADSHTLFLGPRLSGPLVSGGNNSPGTSTPGGFAAKPNLPSSMPSTQPANEPASKYPIQGWSAPQYGFSRLTSQPANGLGATNSANSGRSGPQSAYAQNVGPNNAPSRPLSNGTTGGIALANGPVPGGPILRPVAIERPSTPTTVNSRRELAGQLSTASAPLPAPAVDRSSAKAAARPGVLSMAIYELFQPTTPTGQPQLSTHTAPLPTWTPAPASSTVSSSTALPNRATPSKPPATSGLPTPQLPPEDFGKAASAGNRRGRATLPELRLPDPDAATRSLRAGRSK